MLDEDGVSMKNKPRLYHTCLNSNKNVILSGVIKRLDKKTFIFNNESGHYMPPPKNLNYIKKILKKKYKFISERKDGVYKPYILGKGRGSEILGLKILTFEA